MAKFDDEKLFRLTHAVMKTAGALFTLLAATTLVVLGVGLFDPTLVLKFFFDAVGDANGPISPYPLHLYVATLFVQLVLTAAALRILTNVVETMRAEGPFTPQNIVRLRRLGWLAIAISIMGMLVSAAKAGLVEGLEGPSAAPLHFDIAGPVLALTFFVIAHAFSIGLAREEELDEFV